jgi:putative DNA primase/helicase
MRFEDALRSAGLLPKAIVADGVIRRCGTAEKPRSDNGWYVLHPDARGHWGDWSCGSGEVLGTWKDETAKFDPAKMERIQREATARRAQEREDTLNAIQGARRFWSDASPLSRPHKYIADKGLTPEGCATLRTRDGLLLVPMLWHGERGVSLLNVQTITLDGEKLFRKGAPKKGTCCVLDRPRYAVTALVEGLATGLAIYQSVRMARVVVCFDAGNLLAVAEQLRKVGQLLGSTVVCADNDLGTLERRGFNPGMQFASKVSEATGAGVAAPEGIEGTDWADALKEWGEGGARRIERQVLAKARLVMPP